MPAQDLESLQQLITRFLKAINIVGLKRTGRLRPSIQLLLKCPVDFPQLIRVCLELGFRASLLIEISGTGLLEYDRPVSIQSDPILTGPLQHLLYLVTC